MVSWRESWGSEQGASTSGVQNPKRLSQVRKLHVRAPTRQLTEIERELLGPSAHKEAKKCPKMVPNNSICVFVPYSGLAFEHKLLNPNDRTVEQAIC